MSVLEFFVFVVIAGVCGAIARAVVGGTRGGFVVSVLLGFLGAFLGTWLARLLHFPSFAAVTVDGHAFPVLWSIIGGIVLAALGNALTRPRYVDRYVP